MLNIILAVLVIVIIVFVVVIQRRPATFHVERQTHISAPPAAIFPRVNDFHQWERWSPWAKLDPNMKTTYSGPDSGEGATYAWTGNREVGEGKMMIEESVAHEKILIHLEFMKPFKATNTATFTFTPEGDGTMVVWRMDGTSNFMSKAFGLFMDMDTMVGKSFEQGLADLKEISEDSPSVVEDDS